MHRMLCEQYAVGGVTADGEFLGLVERYDPAADTWDTMASMLTPRSRLHCVAAETFLYAVGGIDAGGSLNVVERYDSQTDTWHAVAPMIARRAFMACAIINVLQL